MIIENIQYCDKDEWMISAVTVRKFWKMIFNGFKTDLVNSFWVKTDGQYGLSSIQLMNAKHDPAWPYMTFHQQPADCFESLLQSFLLPW